MKKNAACWKYFHKFGEGVNCTVKCKKCSVSYKHTGSTTLMKKHAQTHTDWSESECSSVPNTIDSSISKYFPKKLPKIIQKKADDLIIKYFASCFGSLRSIENEHFVKFCELLGYSAMSRRNLMRSLYESAEVKRASIHNLLESATEISITCDIWTSPNAVTSVLGLTAHFFSPGSFERQDVYLTIVDLTGSHTSQNVAEKLASVFSSDVLQKIDFIVTDGASNMVRMCTLLNKTNVHCIAHIVNLCVQAGLETEPLSSYLKSLRSFMKKMKRSGRLREEAERLALENGISYKQPQSDSQIRWDSSFTMIQHYLNLSSVYNVLMLREKHDMIDPNAMDFLQKSCEILKVFKECTKQASLEQENIGLALPLGRMLTLQMNKLICDPTFNSLSTMLQAISSKIEKHFGPMIGLETYRKATFFDPRFAWVTSLISNAEWHSIETEVNMDICGNEVSTVNENQSDAQSASIWSDFFTAPEPTLNSINVELSQYKISVTSSRPNMQSSVTAWWNDHRICFPLLSSVAKKFLVAPIGSVACERLFSTVGIYYSNRRRNRITTNTTKNCLTVALNEKKAFKKTWRAWSFDENHTEEQYEYDSDFSEEL